MMCTFTSIIANRQISVITICKNTQRLFRKYLRDGKSEITIEITLEDIVLEREKAKREAAIEGLAPREYADEELEITAVLRKVTQVLFDYDTLLFHGSTISVDNQAYLFTAKSGTGKSTHTRLWRELLGDKAVMVNDDKPFLRICEEEVIACGSPWNGKHRLGNNIQVPLRAICILERGRENSIKEITPQEALHMLIQQSARPADPQKLGKYLDLIDRLARKVRLYKMTCTPTIEAAQMAYMTMAEETGYQDIEKYLIPCESGE